MISVGADGFYTAYCSDHPALMGGGNTPAEALDELREMLRLVCDGMTNAEIADRLGLRPGTVKNMVSLLLSKTGCISRAQLARYAAELERAD